MDKRIEKVLNKKFEAGERIHLLSAAVAPRPGRYEVIRGCFQDLEELGLLARIGLETEMDKYWGWLVSHVGHPATAQVISNFMGVQVPVLRDQWVPKDGDLAIAIRLRKRLSKPEDIENVTPEDLEILWIIYHEA